MKILLVGQDVPEHNALSPRLQGRGFLTRQARTPDEVRDQLANGGCDVVVLDWELTGAAAAEILAQTTASERRAIVMTCDATAVRRLCEAGASTCLVKPFAVHALEVALRDVPPPPVRLRPRPAGPEAGALAPIETRNPAMNRLLHLAWRAAETDASMLLLGESGTGKSALAAAVHRHSRRRDHAFVTVHCPCLHPQLLESQLFGHVKGAFTGAVTDTVGRVAAADGGTLFLDEVGDLPLELQPKLLRLLQDREFERVGDCETRRVDIRVVAATHRNLGEEVAAGRFREDLYYRLNVVALRIVPLRRRPEDILPSARAFLAQLTAAAGRGPADFTSAAQAMLQGHAWPGNLRELRNTVERAAILCRGDQIDRTDLLLDARVDAAPVPRVGEFVSLAELESAHIREVLSQVGNYRQAADILGVDKSTLYRKLRSRAPTEPAPA
jgi:two-component system, NtrC family, response regulator AlgB